MYGGVGLKKIKIFFVLVVSLLVLAGCGGGVEPVCRNISFNIDYQKNNQDYSIFCSVDNLGNLTATINSPKEIAGLKVFFSGNTVKTEYLGLAQEGAEGSNFYLLNNIYTVFLNLENAKPVSKDGMFEAVLEANDQNCKVTITNMGIPIKLEFSENETELEIKNLTFN